MSYKCCVLGCRSGYRKTKYESKDSTAVSFFSFPSDLIMRKRWIMAIPRNNLVASCGQKVCQLHFSGGDFEHFFCDNDKQSRRSKRRGCVKLSRLKSTVVPHIFPTLPNYLTTSNPRPRSNNCSSSARLSSENARKEECNEEFIQQECVVDLLSLKEKFQKEILPAGYVVFADDETLQFHLITPSKDILQPPVLPASVIVSKDMKIHSFVKGAPVPHSVYEDLLNASYVQKTSELNNNLARCKPVSSGDSNFNHLEVAVALLEEYLALQMSSTKSEDFNPMLIRFIIEQLSLCQVTLNSRRYSTDLLTTAFMWKVTSPALYKQLLNTFALPSVRHLRGLCEDMTMSPGKLDIAKTVLTFMVQSLFGKYKDVVCLIPVDKPDTAMLRTWFDEVMEKINNILLVIAISTDNHVCNRKLFMDLCNGELRHNIEHPYRPGEKLFFIFDLTHNYKNIFNHFVNKKQMHPPTKDNEDILGVSCHAKFLHIRSLYSMEEGKTLKVAHQLKKGSLNPSSIARTSPQHALSMFSESTVRGLQDCIPERYKAIFLMADRGGLAEPTEICFAITLLAVQYFSAVLADDDTIKKLMCCMNQRNVFLDAMRLVMSLSSVFRHLMHIKCESGHLNFNLIVQRAVTQVPDFVIVTSQ